MPVTAVASILHRLTGMVLFAGALWLCYLLDLALAGEAGFGRAAALTGSPLGRLALWLILAALGFHLIAGIRHLLLDFHLGDTRAGGRVGAWLSMILALVVAAGLGVWLW